MAWEMMVGLFVSDPEVYRQYRDAMRPLLESVGGGGFRYDFEVARTLKSEADHDINRVFAIYFADRESKDRFFSNPDYVRIRADLFQKAVRGSTILAGYER